MPQFVQKHSCVMTSFRLLACMSLVAGLFDLAGTQTMARTVGNMLHSVLPVEECNLQQQPERGFYKLFGLRCLVRQISRYACFNRLEHPHDSRAIFAAIKDKPMPACCNPSFLKMHCMGWFHAVSTFDRELSRFLTPCTNMCF